MLCEKCGKTFQEAQNNVCPNCGESLTSFSDQTQNNELLHAIEQLKQGNCDSFPTVYDYTYKYVYSRAKTLCDNLEDVADVVQEVYVSLVQNIASLHSNESVFAWLRTVTFHVGSRVLKKKKRETLLTEENKEWLESLPDESADAEADFVNQQDIEIIHGCINRLPDKLRTVILAHYYDNLKVEEIAQLLEIPVGTVKSRLFAARKKIKQYVEEEEHRLGYKLHSFSAVSLLMAIRSLLQENMTIGEAQKATMYTRVFSELGLSAGNGAVSVSTAVESTPSTTAIVRTAVGDIFKKAAFVSVWKTVVAVVCGVAVVATAAFAGERLMRKQNTPTANSRFVNQTTGTTGQILDNETTVSSSLNTTLTSAVAPTTTATVTTTNKTILSTTQTSASPTPQQTTSTTSIVIKDYDPDPTHEPPQPGDIYETKDYIYRYQWYENGSGEGYDPANRDTSIGWSVDVKNREQTEYEALFDSIYGEPVTMMFYTYHNCYVMTVAPAVPKYITYMAFAYANTSISVAPVLPEGVTELGYAFSGTLIAEAPFLPTSVENLMYTFAGCKNLKVAPEIPASVVDMDGTFSGCTSLVTAPVIPENVSDLYETFSQCKALTGTIIINAKEVDYLSYCFEGTEKPITLTGSAPKEILLTLAESSFNNNITIS